MKLKKIFALCISAALILTGCIQKNDDVELSEEEKNKVLTIINELHAERLNAIVETMKEEGVINE